MAAGPDLLMRTRALLVGLVVLATAAFVVGVSVERSSADSHSESAATAHGGEAAEHGAEGSSEESETHVDEATSAADQGSDEEEEALVGLNVEATPFVALAAAFSLALAALVWLRPAWTWPLALVVVVMAGFAVLDVGEVFHQVDESKGGLAVLAAVVAGLHLAAAIVAAMMRRPTAAGRSDQLA